MVVTIYPFAPLVEELTNGAVEVYSITPKGVRVHTYVVTSKDIDAVERASAMIAIGAEEFLTELPHKEDALLILDHASEYGLWINSSRGPHGMRFYDYDLERITFMIADYLGEQFPRLNETVHKNAHEYVERLHEFVSSLSDLPKGSVVASFPLISYMCLTFNVTPIGPIMPGSKRVSSDRPIVSFIESKGTSVDSAILGIAEENGVPVFYVETFSDDPLSELMKAAAVIIGASVSVISIPHKTSGTSFSDYAIPIILVICLLYLALKDVYVSRAKGSKIKKG